MNSTTLQNVSFPQETRPSVSEALRAVVLSAQRLGVALWHSAIQRQATAPAALTPHDEAASLRAMADDALAKDPSFAQDLYAMADRVERAEIAAQAA
jgi:hypothetical protein